MKDQARGYCLEEEGAVCARVLRLQRAAVIPRGTARALGVSKNLQQILGQGINTQALKRRYASEKHRMKMHFVPPQCPPPKTKTVWGHKASRL